jgi:hypothetical protein
MGSIRNSLYRIGGVAALICALLYVVSLGVYVTAYRVAPPPATVLEWFKLFQTNPFTGLFFLGLADIVIMILWGPLALAIYDALGQSGKTWARVAIAFAFVGIAVYLATNTAFSMLSLSDKYAVAVSETDKTAILAAGQALISISEGTGGQYAGMPLVWLAGLILSVIMLRNNSFSKSIAWAGILGLGLLVASMPFAGYTTTGPTSTGVKVIIAVTYIGGGLLSLAWYILVGLKLIKWGRLKGNTYPKQS